MVLKIYTMGNECIYHSIKMKGMIFPTLPSFCVPVQYDRWTV